MYGKHKSKMRYFKNIIGKIKKTPPRTEAGSSYDAGFELRGRVLLVQLKDIADHF
jgi:hypothetical protein